ncbi:MAG: glycosyltransferase [Cyanobium sp. LacPavin_0920_WC12_MAG_63_22]|nr:glycosyltransferase [Cyanobium sp. LacPavin_0920_WC12_MAG_63_22]
MTDATQQQPRVIGLLAVRDEWPLAAVALVHALLHHVDAVVVLDHASRDATPAGLALLKASALGERIQLLHLDSANYRQEAFMNAMVEVSQAWEPDWIYPFDADEFLLAPGGLKALLASLPEQLLAVHYQLENWISTPDFDESDLDGYLNLQIRSLPDLPMPPVMEPSMVQAIAEGQTNYFRRPFGGKVIFRNTTTAWLEAGSHSLRPFLRSQSLLAHRTHLRGAHLPLLSRVRLHRKAAMGRRHQQAGAPSSFGWQNQMLARLEQQGRLDEFWSRHALDPDDDTAITSDGLRTCRDPDLAEALSPTISLLQELGLPQMPLPAGIDQPTGRAQPLPPELYRLVLRASAACWSNGSGQERSLCVEGWRDLNHSYSLVNQWQLLELLRRPLRLCHRDTAPFNPAWNPRSNGSGLPQELLDRIRQIPAPMAGEHFSAIYRINFPMNLLPGPADQVFVFGTPDYARCDAGMFVGCTPAEASRRDDLSIVTPSRWCQRGFLEAGFQKERIHVLPHGIAPASFFPASPDQRARYRQQLGFQEDDFVLLHLGSLYRNKGIDLLIRAFAELKPVHPRLKLVVKDQSGLHGWRVNDVMLALDRSGQLPALREQQWRDLISISANLDLQGLHELYNACDLYVSPYRAEGFNLPPLEAAACGLPIVVTAGGATDDYFSPELGLTVASELQRCDRGFTREPDPDALKQAIEAVMHNPGRWGGPAGSALVHARFSWQVIGQRLLGLLGLG